MFRTDFINYLIYQNDYKSYLEIGLNNPEDNFIKIGCESKESVDPYNAISSVYSEYDLPDIIKENLTYKMTSDEMFEMLDKDKKYDIIFIDGLHLEEQVIKDIVNSLKHLNNGGKILVHDCLPKTYEAQTEIPYYMTDWNGTVWKAIPKLKELGIDFYVIDEDQGVGVINYFEGAENLNYYEQTTLTFNDFILHRNELMNVVSVKEFLHREEKKHQICFVTPAYRLYNIEAIGLSIKKLIEENRDFDFMWIICVDKYNCIGDASEMCKKVFNLGIPFFVYNEGKPGQKNYGGDLINNPLFQYIEDDWFQRMLDPWIYILDDDNIPSDRIMGAIRRAYAEAPYKRFIWMRYLNELGRIYTPYRFDAFDCDPQGFVLWNTDPSSVLFRYSLFEENGGFCGDITYDFYGVRFLAEKHFLDEVFMLTDMENGQTSRNVSYDSYHNAIPFTDTVIELGKRIDRNECYGHFFAAVKDETNASFTVTEEGHISNSVALPVLKKETLKKIYDLIVEDYKEMKILSREKEEHDLNRFN